MVVIRRRSFMRWARPDTSSLCADCGMETWPTETFMVALDVAAHFQGILLEAELQLVAATPVARLMHFNPEEGSCS
jgi:hypothetical protein